MDTLLVFSAVLVLVAIYENIIHENVIIVVKMIGDDTSLS